MLRRCRSQNSARTTSSALCWNPQASGNSRASRAMFSSCSSSGPSCEAPRRSMATRKTRQHSSQA
eukprot:146630-Lingulodinium_polyedra.AAC.1